jgi:hypothetical protein
MFGNSTTNLTITVPIPSNIDHEAVIQALHNPNNLLNTHPLIQKWEKTENQEEINDLFFSARNPTDKVVPPIRYTIVERIAFVPFLGPKFGKTVAFPVVLQDTDEGSRSKAEAPGGVVVWSDWKVQKKTEETGWELVDHAKLECSTALMSFVKRSMCASHLAIAKGILKAAGADEAKDQKEDGIEIKWSDVEGGN